MDTKVKSCRWLIILIIALLLAYPLGQLGYRAYRYLHFYLTDPSEAEQTIMAYARDNGIDYSEYPQSLIALLERNPETEAFVLQYPQRKDETPVIDLTEYCGSDRVPLFLQWDPRWGYLPYGDDITAITGCGPVCLSMAAFYLTEDAAYSPDKMIRFAQDNGYYSSGNGSSWTLISKGGVQLGFDVTEIPLVESRITKNLEVGNPIICVMGPGDFTTTGHYIVMTGYIDGMIQINDPNSIENSNKLWSYAQIQDQIRNLWVVRKPENA